MQKYKWQRKVFPQRHSEGDSCDIKPLKLKLLDDIAKIVLRVRSPVNTNRGGSEDPGQPGAAQGPGEEVEARHVDALQEEHRVGVEHDRTQPEVVNLVNCS